MAIASNLLAQQAINFINAWKLSFILASIPVLAFIYFGDVLYKCITVSKTPQLFNLILKL